MSKNPEDLEIGEVFSESYECEAIAWKIPHVSSLEITKNTEIRSPRFSYKNATWILKIIAGNNLFLSEKFRISRVMERLHSEIPEHNFYFRTFFKRQDGEESNVGYNFFKFDAHRKENHFNSFFSSYVYWNNILYSSRYRWEDTITLVVEILTKKDTVTKSTKADLGPVFAKNADPLKSIGELSVESFDVNIAAWKIPQMHSLSFKADNKVQSRTISFFGASWILKLFPCGQTKFDSAGVDVVFERLHSHIKNQTLLYDIVFKSCIEKEFLMNDYFCNIPGHFVRGSFSFDLEHALENILEVMSYDECLRYATSSPQFGCFILMCGFRIPKESEIGLNFQMGSVESFKKCTSFMTESIEKPSTGEINQNPFEWGVICWTLPRFSSLLDAGDNSVRSPQFSYKGAVWILEIYPYGRNYTDKKGNMKIFIKRLYSQFAEHKLFCRMFFKDRNDRTFANHCTSLNFDSSHKENDICYRDFPYYNIITLYKGCRYHHILKLVVELYNQKKFESEMDLKAKSFKGNLSNKNTESDDSSKAVGEVSAESFDGAIITWNLPKACTMPTEVDYGVQSPLFSMGGASWILKMFPHGRKKFKSQSDVDVVIEKVFPLFLNHSLSYKVFLKSYDKQIDEKGYPLEDAVKMSSYRCKSGSFIFESNFAKENICHVQSYADFFNLVASNKASDTVFLICDFRIKNNADIKKNIETKSDKSSAGLTSGKSIASSSGTVNNSNGSGFTFEIPKNFSFASLSDNNSSSGLPFGNKKSPSIGSVSDNNISSGFTFGNQKTPFIGSVRDNNISSGFTFGNQKTPSIGSVSENNISSGFTSGNQKSPSIGSVTDKNISSGFTFGNQKTPSIGSVSGKNISSGFAFGCGNAPRKSVHLPNKKLLQDLKELFVKQEECDAVLKVQGREFSAHRLILKARSSVFASTFRNDMKEKATGVVEIEDCDPSSFSDFLYFLYCGSTEKFTTENVFSLFTTADKYDVQDLRSECLKFIKKTLSVDTVCDAIALAIQHSERELIELATDFFSKNLQKVILTVKWQSFLVKNPIQGNEILIKALASNNPKIPNN